MDKQQIIVHSSHSTDFTCSDIKWIPSSPKLITIGQKHNGNGILEIFKITDGSLKSVSKSEQPIAFKCSTFGNTTGAQLTTGDYDGNLKIWDLNSYKLTFNIKAHDSLINCIDGIGGRNINIGPPEIVTGSRDVWDQRQSDPVAVFQPADGQPRVDPWSVCFGNASNSTDRFIAAGYENGDLKLFDLKTMSIQYQTNLNNGICSVEFDRKDIAMNKLVVTGLESKFHVFDLRTFNKKQGYAYMSQKTSTQNTTGWLVKHLPQNRDVFILSSGSGTLDLFKYNYPSNRKTKDEDGNELGVTGKLVHCQSTIMADQPIGSFDWSQDKQGLFCFAGYDQQIRVGMVTRLNTI